MAKRSQSDLEANALRAGGASHRLIEARLQSLYGCLIDHGDWPIAYFPLAICAALEVFFRRWLQEILSCDEIYLVKIKPRMKEVRIDYENMIGLGGRKISLEEIISLSIGFGGIQGAIDTAGALFDCDFRKKMLGVRQRWYYQPSDDQGDLVIENAGDFFSALDDCFRVRHILAHELPSECPCAKADIENYLRTALAFVSVFDAASIQLAHPDAPRTQTDMNIRASDEIGAVRAEVDKLTETYIEVVKSTRTDRVKHLKAEINSWERFLHYHAIFEGSEAEGGSMAPLLRTRSMAHLLEERVINLKKYLREVRRDTSYWWEYG